MEKRHSPVLIGIFITFCSVMPVAQAFAEDGNVSSVAIFSKKELKSGKSKKNNVNEEKNTNRDKNDAQSAESVVVTGTRANGRTVHNSAAPIDLISQKDLAQTGATNILEAMGRLLPSFNVPALVQPDLGSMVRGAQLRNMDPAYTLVLVNGKRRHTTAVVNEDGFPGSVATDLSLIPTASIDHIEVLRDGASAIYGSDALAGVINIVLKKDTKGTFSGQGGSTYDGGGTNGYVRADKGFSFDHGKGFVHLSAEFNRQDMASRNFPLKSGYLSYPAVSNTTGALVALGSGNTLPAGTHLNPKEAGRNNTPWKNVGSPSSTLGEFAWNAGYDLTKSITFYSFGTYSYRDAASVQNYRLPNTVFKSNLGLYSVYPDGFNPYETMKENDFSATGGIKWKTGKWDWDLSGTYGEDDIDVGVTHSANYALSYPGSQTAFHVGNRNYGRFTGDLDVRRSFNIPFFAKPLDFSSGFEFQNETQSLGAGEYNSYVGSGSSGLVGYLPVDANSSSRHSFAGYVGLASKVTKNWTVDLAGRIESYSDFGKNFSGRFSTRYDITNNFAFRATVSNGFHAPSLVTESYSNTSDHNGTSYMLAQPTSGVARALGASPLKPETSRDFTAGLVYSPEKSVNLSLDVYEIDVANRIGTSADIGIDRSTGVALDGSGNELTTSQVNQIETLLNSAGISAGNGLIAHYFTNIGNTRTRGLDFTADGHHAIGGGTFRWTAGVNINDTLVTKRNAIPSVLQGLPNIGILSKSTEYTLRYRSPPDKEIVSLSYQYGKFSIFVRETHYGALKRYNDVTGGSYNITPSFVTDLNIGYDVTKRVNVTVGANNLLNQYPSKIPKSAIPAYNSQFTGLYDNSGPLGVLGGYYCGRVSVKL
ncbi:MAG: TonB-dependent receptor [Acetobacter persici]|uniref:TonB-dependent receptor plug domain-containing protein n=1 Tax=Acetobacter persici TaxID=1076596 RepID=UPI0039EADC70